MNAWPLERIAATGAAAVAAGSLLFFGSLAWTERAGKLETSPVLRGAPYTPAATANEAMPVVEWRAPRAQQRGRGWIYEIFTPPEIRFDPVARRFRLSSADDVPAPASNPAAVPTLRLKAVAADLYPLHLAGHLRGPGGDIGTFENRLTGETLILRPGDRVPSLGLVVQEIVVRTAMGASDDGADPGEQAPLAIVRDERTGVLTNLREGLPSSIGVLHADITSGDSNRVWRVREGDTVDDGIRAYRVEALRASPPAADLARDRADGGDSERLTLTVADAPPSLSTHENH